MVKKLKLLILDDEHSSMDLVLKHAIRQHPDVYEEDALKLIGELIDIRRCYSVSDAKAECRKFQPDLVFTDLKIDNPAEQDTQALKLRYQGIEFIHWLRSRYAPDFPIKVHSQYGDLYEVKKELDRSGISVLSHFTLQFDLEKNRVSNETLKDHFPELLQQLAQNYFNGYAKNAEMRSVIKMKLREAITNDTLDAPIKQLGEFSARSLMAGWLYLNQTPTQATVVEWACDPLNALDELAGVAPGASAKIKIAASRQLVDSLREHPQYAAMSKQAQTHAFEVLNDFFNNWRHTAMGRLRQDAHHLRLETPLLREACHHIEIIKKVPLVESDALQHHIKTLSLRLVVGGIYELKYLLYPCLQQQIIDCAILGCIRNSSAELMNHQNKVSQVKKYLSALGLGKMRQQGNPSQLLNPKKFFDDEKAWLANLRQTIS